MPPPSPGPERRSLLNRLLEGPPDQALGRDPGAFDADAVAASVRHLDPIFRPGGWHGVEVEGWERIPPPPVLVVANHSGGTTIPDAWGLGWLWYRRFGIAPRPLHVLAHDMIFSLRPLGAAFERRGAVRADPPMALSVLREWGRDLMVWPGGDVETWRPWKDRHRLRWGRRTGYARIALRAGVPIVPIACDGAHDTLMVLTDGRKLARALHLHQLARADIFPVHLSIPWGLGIGPLPHLPLPRRFRYRVGEPILPREDVDPDAAPPPELVREHDRAVRAEMRRLLDGFAAEEAAARAA